MFILDYRASGSPAHHEVGDITLTGGALSVLVGTTFPLLEGAPTSGFSRLLPMPMIDLGIDPLSAVVEWLVSDAGPFAGCPVVSEADLPLASKRLALASAVKRNRDSKRDGGCNVQIPSADGDINTSVDTDINSRLNIAGAVSMAAIAGAAFSVDWRMSDNSIVTLDAAGVTGMGVAVGQFVAACQARKNILDAEIDAATTLAELEAIDVDSGWPE